MQFEKERGWSFRTVILVKGWGIIVRARRMEKERRDKILFVCTHSFFDTQVYYCNFPFKNSTRRENCESRAW